MHDWTEKPLDNAFGHPRGLLGRVGGEVMARVNAVTERQLVRLAEPNAGEDVLVLGPGPGVGLRAVAERAASAVGVEPSELMRRVAGERCADLLDSGAVRVQRGTAEATGLPDASVDVVLSVNNLQFWPDRPAALTELRRVLRPHGRLLLSVHERCLTEGRAGLLTDVRAAGFEDAQCWAWQPPRGLTPTAAQLRARR